MDHNDTMLHVLEIHILLTAPSNILRWNMELNLMITLYKNNMYIIKLYNPDLKKNKCFKLEAMFKVISRSKGQANNKIAWKNFSLKILSFISAERFFIVFIIT